MGDGRDRMRLVMRQSSAYSQKPHWELESLYKPKPRPVFWIWAVTLQAATR